MNRTTAMILTIASILLCGCPGLAFCVFAVYAFTVSPQTLLEAIQAQGFNVTNSGNLPAELMASKIILMLIAVVLIAIPIIIGLVTLRNSKRAKLQPAAASRPVSMAPARPVMYEQPAVVSRPAAEPPARPAMNQPPAPQPTPVVPVYEPPTPAPEPEPQPPAMPPDPAAPVAPPENQPEEALPQVFATVEAPAPAVPEGATRVASTWCLVFVSGPSPVSTIVLEKKVSVGRSAENDVAILDPLVSRQHAVVELAPAGGGYQVTDLGSANGTFINDAPLTGPAHLRVGDLVKFGGTVFRFQPLYEMK